MQIQVFSHKFWTLRVFNEININIYLTGLFLACFSVYPLFKQEKTTCNQTMSLAIYPSLPFPGVTNGTIIDVCSTHFLSQCNKNYILPVFYHH